MSRASRATRSCGTNSGVARNRVSPSSAARFSSVSPEFAHTASSVAVGAADGADTPYTQVNATGPIAWVLGAEGKGLRHLTRQRCSQIAAIPMADAVESLNVSVAAGVVMFEAARQRQLAKLVNLD